MEQALVFRDVVVEEKREPLSFSVPRGVISAVVTSRQDESDRLVRLLLGLAQPLSGSIATLGEELAAAGDKALAALRRRVAVVHPGGGLVSNLKVWENLVLPLEYHSLCTPLEVEERGRAMLQRLGYTGGLMELPGHLSLYERRLIGLGRALLLEPELIVYNGILGGLRSDERSGIVANAVEFQRKEPKRTSLFLTANVETIAAIPFDSRIFLNGSVHDT